METTKVDLQENVTSKTTVQGVPETPMDELFIKGVMYSGLGILQYFLVVMLLIGTSSVITKIDNAIHNTHKVTAFQKLTENHK